MMGEMASCAYCGTQGVGFKFCGGCRQVAYCGAECQKTAWRGGHKTTCGKPLLSPEDLAKVYAKVLAASAVDDWREVLKWEGRMEELVKHSSNEECVADLNVFIHAHLSGQLATGSTGHFFSIARLINRRVELLGKMERFRDQGEAMCTLSSTLIAAGKREEGERWYQRARDVGAAHGFFSVESSACLGLGELSMQQGRHEEGAELLRNALVAANLSEHEGEVESDREEMHVLDALITALFDTAAIDEVEPLVVRYRELAKAETDRIGGLSRRGLWSFYFNARLHEVPCLRPSSWDPLHTARPMQSIKTANVSHRIRLALL